MRAVTFKALLSAVAALDGGQALTAVAAQRQATYAEALNFATRYAYNWAEWPELGNSRAMTVTSGLVSWQETGYPIIGSVRDVTLDNPDTYINPRPTEWRFNSNGTGIQVFNSTASTVWVRYAALSPAFTTVAWSNATAYSVNEVVYDATTGDCYEAVQAGTNHAVTDTAYWRRLQIPAILRMAIARGAYAILIGAKGQKQTETLLATNMDAMLGQELDQIYLRAGLQKRFSAS